MSIKATLKNMIVRCVPILMLGIVFQGLATAQTSSQSEILGQPLGDAFNAPAQVQASQTRLIVYRPQADASTTGVVRVYVNDSYHTALMPTSYSLLCLAPGSIKVEIRQPRRNKGQADLSDVETQIQLDASKTVYLSIQMREGARYGLKSVDATVATQELKATSEQIHVVTRVAAAQECQDPTKVTVTPAVVTTASAQTSAGSAGANRQ